MASSRTATMPADILLDTGRLFVDRGTVPAAALVGATRGGGFRHREGATLRGVEYDGMRAARQGLQRIVGWNGAQMTGTILQANAANTAMLSVGATVATATVDGAPTTTVSPKDAGVMLVLADYETNVRLTFDRGNGGTWSVVYPLAYVSEWSQETADINEVGFACTIVPVQTAEQSDDEAPFYYEITGPDITV